MSEVRKTPRARADLREIWLYIARDNPEHATRFLRSIDEKCRTLADFPMMGRSRPELGPELRSFPVGHYAIFYRPLENGVEIVRILHQARDIEVLF